MNNRIYNIDFKRFILLLLPIVLRRPKLFAFLRSMVTPIASLNVSFGAYREEVSYNLSHNSQVCYLTAMLNDNFDRQLRRIRVEDMERNRRTYLYLREEQKPIYLGTEYIHLRSEFSDNGYDFRVVLNGVVLSEGEPARMRALINYYKLASKRYLIV